MVVVVVGGVRVSLDVRVELYGGVGSRREQRTYYDKVVDFETN